MSTPSEMAIKQVARAPMSVFERYLTVWAAVCLPG